MSVEILMPQMGLTMTEGTVIKWLKSEGDFVTKDEAILEIESDKATFQVESPAEGTLLQILVGEGEVAPIAAVIGYIGNAGEQVSSAFSQTEVKMEDVLEAAAEQNVKNMEVSPVKMKAQGRVFISPRARRALKQKGLPETAIMEISGSGSNGRIIEKDILLFEQKQATKVTPFAQKIADEYGVNLTGLKGTDIGGKVTSEDVLNILKEPELPTSKAIPFGDEILEIIPLKGMRKVIAERMHYSTTTIPRVTHTTEVDVTEMAALRKRINSILKEEEKVSFLDIMIKIGAVALERHPKANARLDQDGIKLLANSHIGLAVDTEAGLVVPNIKQCNKKSLRRISQKTKDLIQRAKSGKLLPDEMTGGTFTISNLGGPKHGIDGFTPIINWPEATILGLGRMIEKPWVVNGEIAVRTMMVLSLTFDHRIIDGGPAAEFLHTIKKLLENPLELVLGV